MLNKILRKCDTCGQAEERNVKRVVATCFNCKKENHRRYAKKQYSKIKTSGR